jgi:hypothetical protein
MIVNLTLAHRAALVVFAFSVALVATWRLWPRSPAMVDELRRLPGVRTVEYVGRRDAKLTVVHLLDWHHVPRELCQEAGIDFAENLKIVEAVQLDQLGIARHLIREHGVKAIYSEGLSEKSMADYRLRLDLFDAMSDRREARLLLGIPGRLLLTKEIDDVLPLEEADALAAAAPTFEDGGTFFDAVALIERRKAMVRMLPREGLAVIVLGASHDLGPMLGRDVLYIRVRPRSLP